MIEHEYYYSSNNKNNHSIHHLRLKCSTTFLGEATKTPQFDILFHNALLDICHTNWWIFGQYHIIHQNVPKNALNVVISKPATETSPPLFLCQPRGGMHSDPAGTQVDCLRPGPLGFQWVPSLLLPHQMNASIPR